MIFNWSKESAHAVKACWSTPEGRLALSIVVEHLGLIHGDSDSLDPHEMAFTKGRRFVARELMNAINTPLDKLAKEPDVRPNRPLTGTERAAVADANGGSAIAAARKRTSRNA